MMSGVLLGVAAADADIKGQSLRFPFRCSSLGRIGKPSTCTLRRR